MKIRFLVCLALVALGFSGCGESEIGIDIGGGLRQKEIIKTLSKVDGQNAISVYLISKAPLKGTLLAKALDDHGQEIGRATAEIDLKEDDAKYVSFKFDGDVDAKLVKSYLVDLKSVE